MALTLTRGELAKAIRVGPTVEESDEVMRLLTYATEAISKHLGAAYATTPAAVCNEAAVRLCGYLYDQPTASRGEAFAHAMRNSGAARMLLPYVVHSLGSTGEAVAAAQAVTESGVDQTARDAAAAAQRSAESALSIANANTRPMPATPAEAAGGTATTIRSWTAALIRRAIEAVVPAWARAGDATPIPAPKLANAPRDSHLDIVDTLDGRLPAPPVAMRLGWAQSRTMTAAVFTRANDHPIDGAATGTTAGLAVPPFPPALDTDPTLYLGVWLAGNPEIAAIRRGEVDATATFPTGDKVALTVDGTAGHYYPSSARFSPLEGDLLRVVVPGPRILTENDAVAGGAAPRWYEMARLLTNSLAAGSAGNMILRSDGMAKYADAAAVRAAVASKEISMLVFQRSDSDAQVPGIVAPNFIGSAAANYAIEFRFPNGEHATVRFLADNITVTPGFAISSTLRFDLGVFA